MSIEEHSINIVAAEPTSPIGITQQLRQHWYTALRSPLWLCLLLALIIRVWLIARTHGVIDGDEVLIGIQAEHILRGELPIYFYGQPYMGSLEAYLVALLLAIAGPSVWALRAEPILLSLLLVWLTWRLAAALADLAHLSAYAKRTFMTIAALLAAIPPLYDSILELRTYGGYIETFILMLLLLLSALQVTQRWHAGASQRELTLRWAGIGFIVGLGFWIHPLIISAVFAAALWIIFDWIRSRQAPHPIKYLLTALVAIPTSLIGFAPALLWGATHQWQNISYVLGLGGSDTVTHRLSTIRKVTYAYATCVAPRVISGALPKEAPLLTIIHSPLLIVGVCCIFTTVTLVAASFIWHNQLLLRIRHLAALPTLFAASTALVFCTSKATMFVTISCNYDITGRYAVPLALISPFFFATLFTIASIYLHQRSPHLSLSRVGFLRESLGNVTVVPSRGGSRVGWGKEAWEASGDPCGRRRWRFLRLAPALGWGQIILFAFLFLYLGAQVWTYGLTDPGYTLQSPYCLEAPANNEPIIAYMQHQHIHYAWASNWLAYGIVFKTNSTIIVADPLPFIPPSPNFDRIPANTDAVRHADRPTLLVFVHHTDTYPLLLQYLDSEQVTYHAARFPSEPGIDVLVVTPLNRTVSPFESSAFSHIFTSCND